MIEPGQVSVTIPTRGNVDMTPILDNLRAAGYEDIIVWNNSLRTDDMPYMGIYGRYKAVERAKHDIIYTQDDDILFHKHEELLARYKPGIVCISYPQPWDTPWVSCGAVFDKRLVPPPFIKYLSYYPFDDFLTDKAADAVFGLLNQVEVYGDLGYDELPWAKDAGRCSTEPNWYDRDRPEARRRCYELKMRGG